MNIDLSTKSSMIIKTLLLRERKKLMNIRTNCDWGFGSSCKNKANNKQLKKGLRKETIEKIQDINEALIELGYKFKSSTI